MTSYCSSALDQPLAEVVVNTYGNQFFEWARASRSEASEAQQLLLSVSADPVNFNASYDLTLALADFSAPSRPDTIEVEFGAVAPIAAMPERPDATSLLNFTQAPDVNIGDIPLPTFGPSPGALVLPNLGDGPTLTTIVVPDAPTIADIELPVFIDLELPTYTPVVVPLFEGVRPTRDFDMLDNTFSYEEPEYDDALLGAVKARMTEMLAGTTGLPVVVEQAIFARGVEREERNEFRAIQEVYHETAAKGHDRPPGATEARIAETRQAGANRRAGLSRDTSELIHKVAIDNLRFCVTNIIALEQVTIGLHNAIADRLLRVEELTVRMAIEILNSRIAVFNIDQQAYAVDAQVYRDLIGAAELEIRQLQALIEASKVRAEINRDLVAIYEARQRAAVAEIDRYRSIIEAKRVESELNSQLLEQYKTQAEVLTERVRAKSIEWDGYRAHISAESEKQRTFELRLQSLRLRMDAWATAQSTEVAKGDFYVREFEADIRLWIGDMERMRAELGAETARVDSEVRVHEADLRGYVAAGQVEDSRQQANQRSFELLMRQEESKKQLTIQKAQLDITQMIETAKIILSKTEGYARNQVQLAASSMAGLNIGASISAAQNASCDTNYSFSGEIV